MTTTSNTRLAAGVMIATILTCSASGAPPPDYISDHLAGPVVQLHGSGAGLTLKILFLGDGFTSDGASMGAYRAAVDKAAADLLATDPFQALSSAITIYRLDVISDEAGIDVPVDCDGVPYDPPTPFMFARSAKSPENALESHWCAASVVSGQNQKSFLSSDSTRVADFTIASGIVPDLTIVLVNDWMFGATAWADDGIMYVSIGQNLIDDRNPDDNTLLTPNDPAAFPAVITHEIGHLAPFLLLDEYSTTLQAGELAAHQDTINVSANLTTQASPLKWVSLATTVPPNDIGCPSAEVGRVSGGYGFVAGAGVFHSSCECRMNDWSHAAYCVVCRDQIMKTLARHRVRHVEIPHARPDTAVVRPDPSPAWVLLDSIEIRSGPSGIYSLQYILQSDAGITSGVWPPRSGAPATGALLVRGQPHLAGEILGLIPNAAAHPAPLTFEYKLFWRPDMRDTTAPAVLISTERIQIPLDGEFAGIVAANRPTHRITLGLVPGR